MYFAYKPVLDTLTPRKSDRKLNADPTGLNIMSLRARKCTVMPKQAWVWVFLIFRYGYDMDMIWI